MTHLDELLLTHISAMWRDTDRDDFEQRVNTTYAAYLAAGGTDEQCKERWQALSAVAARRLRKLIKTQSATGYFYIKGHMLYFEGGTQVCPKCKVAHSHLYARCTPCQDAKNYRDALVAAASA